MKLNHHPSLRPQFILGFVLTVSLLAAALFMQYQMNLNPCPLCILQRAAVIALSLIFLVGLLHNPMGWSRRIYALFLTLFSAIGIGLALRQVWLQHLPKDQIPECGPGIEFWIERLPADQVLMKMLQGTGDCAKVVFNFMELSIAEWMIIIFTLFFLFSLKILLKNK